MKCDPKIVKRVSVTPRAPEMPYRRSLSLDEAFHPCKEMTTIDENCPQKSLELCWAHTLSVHYLRTYQTLGGEREREAGVGGRGSGPGRGRSTSSDINPLMGLALLHRTAKKLEAFTNNPCP
jgi:hypothetical protein